jgi:hypothetical protein
MGMRFKETLEQWLPVVRHRCFGEAGARRHRLAGLGHTASIA